jgi:hypothetical protein
MKKIVILVMLLVFALAGCSEKIEPLENPEPELFSEFYLGDNFTILKRTIIEDKAYYTIGYPINDGYVLGAVHLDNYRILYNDEYYDLQQGYKLGLYDAENLLNYGIQGMSRSCSYDDSCD